MSILTRSQLTFTDLKDAYHIQIDTSYIALDCNKNGAVNKAQIITINFGAYMGANRISTINTTVSHIPSGVTVNNANIIEATSATDGSISLSIAAGAIIANDVAATMEIIFTINDSSSCVFSKYITFVKSIVGADGADGGSIWSTTTGPATSGTTYTFTSSNLTGATGSPKIGDIIIYSYYRYTVTSVTSTTAVCANTRVSIRGATGATGADGEKGDTGVGIGSITNYYAVSSSNSTAPTTWSTSVQTMTASNKYLWNYEKVTYTDGATSSTTPCVIGAYGNTGATGIGISSVTEYYAVSSSNSTAPTSWSTTVPTLTSTNRYLWNYETIKYTNNSTSESAKRVIGVYGDKGSTGASAVTYVVKSSVDTVTRNISNQLSPTSITFSFYKQTGNSTTQSTYSGRCIIAESNDGSAWTNKYTSSANESSHSYTPSSGTISYIKCTLYAAGGTSSALNIKTVNVIFDSDTFKVLLAQENGQTIIDGSKILTKSIVASSIASNTITADKLATNAVTTDKLAAGAITTNKLAANAVTADKINVTDLFAQDITATGKITGVTLEGAKGSFSGNVEAASFKYLNEITFMYDNGAGDIFEAPLVHWNQNTHRNHFLGDIDFQDVVTFDLTTKFESNITVGSTISAKNAYYFDAPSTTEVFLSPYWRDGARHSILGRAADGLTCNVGWSGSPTYASVLNLRGRTVRVINSSGTSTISDERMKKDWLDLSRYKDFYNSLEPKAFRYIDGTSGRFHIGYSAQSVEKALSNSDLTNDDFGGIVKYHVDELDDNYHGYSEEYGLIYTEFVALNTYMIQEVAKDAKNLRLEIEKLRNEVNRLRNGG